MTAFRQTAVTVVIRRYENTFVNCYGARSSRNSIYLRRS